MAGISFLEGLGRRPQRLIGLAVVFLVILSFSTWLTLSPSGYDSVRSGFSQHLPTSWSPSGWTGSSGSGAGVVPPKDVADLYTHNTGKPSTAEELMQWSTKGKDGNIYPPTFVPQMANQAPRAKAGFIVLVRNGELDAMKESMKEGESIRTASALETAPQNVGW